MFNIEFLAPYASVLIFVIIATGIALAMVTLPFVISLKSQIKKSYQHMSVVLSLLVMQEVSLILDSILLGYYLFYLIWK